MDLTEEQERMLREAAAENEARAARKKDSPRNRAASAMVKAINIFFILLVFREIRIQH